MQKLMLLVACLERLGATDIIQSHERQVDFMLEGDPGFAYLRADDVVCGAVWVGLSRDEIIDYAEALAWQDLQETPLGCELAVLDWEDGPEIWAIFERPLDGTPGSGADPLRREVAAFSQAWRHRATRRPDLCPDLCAGQDPGAIVPGAAWLLTGRADVFPDDQVAQAREGAVNGVFDTLWPADERTRPGDLLVLSADGTRRAVHFVARAARAASWGGDGRCQVAITPPVPIHPVSLAELGWAAGELLAGGLTAHQVAALSRVARPRDEADAAELAWVLQPVVADPEPCAAQSGSAAAPHRTPRVA